MWHGRTIARRSTGFAMRWYRTTAIGFAILFLIAAAWNCWTNLRNPEGNDFLSFWAAGRLALQGRAALAYNIPVHWAVENSVVRMGALLPFPYPPPFLAIVAPFALVPYGLAFILWLILCSGYYAFASSRIVPLSFAFAFPPVCINLLIGQTGFLTAGTLILGLGFSTSNPWVAGAVLGLMVMKPQLALLLPIAMLAGREWRVIAGAVLSATVLLLLGLLLFGPASYEGFFNILPHYLGFMRENRVAWHELASPFAFARFVGVPQAQAIWVQMASAIVAASLTARAWALRLDERVPILAAATALVSPYFFTYDALLLIIPIGWVLREQRRPFVLGLIWLCCLLPIITYFTPVLGANMISFAAAICLCVLHDRPGAKSSKLAVHA